MLNKIYSHRVQLLFALGLVFCLVLVRFYEEVLFYDPFLAYFKSDFNQMPLPVFNSFLLILNLLFRYSLNMLLSLGLIYVLFKDSMMVQFSFLLYLLAFIVLLLSFFLVIYFYGAENNFLLFNIRRFLIQPIFVLLFIPAFYFQKRHS
jgi:exosortase F-associated protein